ncbi:hypothetical protein PIB30_015650 [Stylosanthes scabra]|uniref:F-box domain-containing protein n=1 Tax=Stylosanthes scabra TaxID=79078 RepID=A0ABU6T6U5_9FABA|nr:hypothetical protein [Stylosanthes scabra]
MAERKALKVKAAMSTTMDMISNLPDDIILHILSFLPTRTSIATSLLSRRWRHLWKGVEVLDIEDLSFCFPSVSDQDARKRFFAFAKGVLSRHKAHRVLKFRLSGMVFSWQAIAHWIEFNIKPHLEDLCISLNSSLQINRRLFCCSSIFTCSSLVFLVLEGTLALHNHLPIVNLPSLKNLKLNVYSVDLEKILSGCPVLETLNVSSRRIYSDVIHMPHSLKSFKFEFIGESKHPYSGGCAIKSIEIDTPSLEYLQIILHHCRVRNLVCNLPKLVEAHLYIGVKDLHVRWVPKLLRALCTIKLLVLGDSTVENQVSWYHRAPGLTIAEIINPSSSAAANNNNNQKPLAIPISNKLNSENFFTWTYQVIQTISGQKLQNHLDKEKVPTQYATDADKAIEKETQGYQDWRIEDYNVNS